ncbi:hypothetical protein BTE77_30355 [Ensifer adhaerens]|jgi:hypothetical protein|nr:hypothetical protein BTE77_30355 [Ensifer adhaerens]
MGDRFRDPTKRNGPDGVVGGKPWVVAELDAVAAMAPGVSFWAIRRIVSVIIAIWVNKKASSYGRDEASWLHNHEARARFQSPEGGERYARYLI